jgi:hypothetical protein
MLKPTLALLAVTNHVLAAPMSTSDGLSTYTFNDYEIEFKKTYANDQVISFFFFLLFKKVTDSYKNLSHPKLKIYLFKTKRNVLYVNKSFKKHAWKC